MTYAEKWNKICKFFYENKNKSEDYIQNLWEKLFSEIFGYSSLDNEIESKRKLQLGSTERLIPDIIIKNDRKDLFIVELKREDLSVAENRKGQLYSYLKQLHCDLGLLICDKICLIDYDYNTSDENQISTTIDFTDDNPAGIKFVELFSKENFDKMNVKEFIQCNVTSSLNISKIENELTPELIKRLLQEFFLKNYAENEVEAVLNKYNISFIEKKCEEPFVQLAAIGQTNSVQRRSFSSDEKLLRDLRTVGFATFVKYYKYYANPHNSSGDVKKVLMQNENYSSASYNTKASTGKSIINRGLGKAALKIIANANNADFEIVQEANRLLSES